MTSTATTTRTTATLSLCGCGCGNPVKSAKSIYCPGHDARHAGLAAREALATGVVGPILNLPTGALQAKAYAMVERLQAKAAKPARQSMVTTGTVKVGRWTYPARQSLDGTIVRNTKRDGSGEWVGIEGVEFAA